jgi:probable rRNA maturation factor
VPLAIDILVESPLWNKVPGLKTGLRKTLAEAAAVAAPAGGEVAVVLTDDPAIRLLNRAWRQQDRPTNVLSFPTAENHTASAPRTLPAAGTRPHARGRTSPPVLWGDIVIAYETTAREAAAQEKPLADHVAHLAVHGFLHLLGYDHQARTEAEAMERLEIAVLARLKVPNPYVAPGRKG